MQKRVLREPKATILENGGYLESAIPISFYQISIVNADMHII